MDVLRRFASHPGAVAAVAGASVVAVMVVRAIAAGSTSAEASEVKDPESSELLTYMLSRRATIAASLAEAITFKTISFENSSGNAVSLTGSEPLPVRPAGCSCGFHDSSSQPVLELSDAVSSPSAEAVQQSKAAFLSLHQFLSKSYPAMHSALEKHIINTFSLVFIWRGSDHALPPIGFAAHQDVVAVPDAAAWSHPPFDGHISADGFVWGRGSIDDKQSLVGLCEAVEALLVRGFTPKRTIVLAFGHDEELGGMDGAAHISARLPALLTSDGSPHGRLEWLLDEGLFLLRDFFPGVPSPVAVVCTGEKGHVNVELSVQQPAGHSSVPPRTTSIGILARAVTRLEASPFPAHLYPASQLFNALLPAMTLFPYRLLFANTWITGPLIKAIMLANPRSAALLRTTTAVTMQSGGVKSNVLPPRAEALVNHRIHPSESVQSVLQRDAQVIGDARVVLRALEPLEPAPVSDARGPGFQLISQAVRSVFAADPAAPSEARLDRDPVVAPGTMLGNTDTRHYWSVARDIYRHCPTQLTMGETAMFHGRDERISISNLARIAAFYGALMITANK